MTVTEELAILVAITESVDEAIELLGMEAVYALSMFQSANQVAENYSKAA